MNVVCLATEFPACSGGTLSFLGDRVDGLSHELLCVVSSALLFGLESGSEVTVRGGKALGV